MEIVVVAAASVHHLALYLHWTFFKTGIMNHDSPHDSKFIGPFSSGHDSHG